MFKKLNELKDVTKKFTEKELKKYQDKLEKLSEKLENEGVEVESIDDVSVQVFNTGEDGTTLRVYGVVNLSSKLKNLDEVNKVLKIAKPYLFKKDGEVFGLDELCNVGDRKVFVTLDFIMKPSDWTLKESKKSFKEFKKSKLNESTFERAEKDLEYLVNSESLSDLDITSYEVVKSIHDNDYIKDEEGYDYAYWGEIHFSNNISEEDKKEYKDWYETEFMGDLYFYENTMNVLLGYGDENDMKIDTLLENKKQFKQFTSKAINEAELTELKDAIINREEFVDENVVGTSIGEDYMYQYSIKLL